MKFKYSVPSYDPELLMCDWNEGGFLFDPEYMFKSMQDLDRYVRSYSEGTFERDIRSVLEVPGNFDFRAFPGSDAAVLHCLSYLKCSGQNKLHIQDVEYAQVKAFAECLGFEIVIHNSIQEIESANGVLYFSNPGNPSCNLYNAREIEKICTNNRDAIVLADYAYIEYHEYDIESLAQCNNLVILRTFSKYWGGAGIRLGAALVPKESAIKPFLDVINSKFIGRIHVAYVEQLAANINEIHRIRKIESEELNNISKELHTKYNIKVSGAGNFIRLDFQNQESAVSFYENAISNGVKARTLRHIEKLHNSIRLSYRIGLRDALRI